MAEAAGLVLGVLPLVIEVAKRYKATYKVFTRFKNCGSETEEFQRSLNVEQTCFCSQVHILLASLTSFDTANKILAQDDHPLSMDPEADRKFSQHLGESGHACVGIIGKIRSEIAYLEKFLQKPTKEVHIWRLTKRRLKFAFADTNLSSKLAELAKLNADFIRISSQVDKLKEIRAETRMSVSQKTRYSVDQYETVRKAAVWLFDALGKACHVHPEHWAQVEFEPKHIIAKNGAPPLVRFIMAFTQRLLATNDIEEAPVWVVIESMLHDSLAGKPPERQEEVQHALSSLKTAIKRANESLPPQITKKVKTKKGVTFVTPKSDDTCDPKHRANDMTGPPKPQNTNPEAVLPDLSKDHNFCLQIQRSIASNINGSHECIGYITRENACQHRVFPNSDIAGTQRTKSMSLARMIDLMPQQKYSDRMLGHECLQLARQLATAVLQFHATPLLKSSWRSEDVVFFGFTEIDLHKRLTLMSPHLNVRVKDKFEGQTLTYAINNHHSWSGPAGNPYLFGLGVILIELAYQVPFRSLRRDEDLVNGAEDSSTDFRTAERLSVQIGNGLGRTYGKIVRRCLFCNFGEDTRDLGDPILQAAFHRDVLCELENLESRMKKIQLGD